MALFWGWIFEALLLQLDMQYLRKQAKEAIKECVTEHLPEQYQICLTALTLYSNTHLKYCKLHRITERSCRQWNYSRTPIWLNSELLSNATTIDSALNFIRNKQQKSGTERDSHRPSGCYNDH